MDNTASKKKKKNDSTRKQLPSGQNNEPAVSKRRREPAERLARLLITICAMISIIAVGSISIYMLKKGTPALFEVGIFKIIFGTKWAPTAAVPSYGILYIILSSIAGTGLAILIGVPAGLLSAVFLSEVAPKRLANIVKPAVELLAGIPSVVYGLAGIMILNPLIYKWEMAIYSGSKTHQFTGGANLLSGVLVLAVMILPTVINMSEAALRSVPAQLRAASYALGASRIQTIFKVVIPAAKSGIATAIVLGIGRAIGESMAVSFVAGNSVNLPFPFNSVRFLTTALVSEMEYSADTHREVLFTIGLVLFAFIMIINLLLSRIVKSRED